MEILYQVNWSLLVGLTAILAALVYYWKSDVYREGILSKRRKQARWKQAKEWAEDEITKALERTIETGKLDRLEADRIYDLLRRAGLREAGTDPSFGRPWYYGPTLPNLKELKGRLKQKWDHHEKRRFPWSKLTINKDDSFITKDTKAKLLDSIKRRV